MHATAHLAAAHAAPCALQPLAASRNSRPVLLSLPSAPLLHATAPRSHHASTTSVSAPRCVQAAASSSSQAMHARASSSGRQHMPVREAFRQIGDIGDDTYKRVNALNSGLLDEIDPERAAEALTFLKGLGLRSENIQLILLRHPRTFQTSVSDLQDVVSFLSSEPLNFRGQALNHIVTKFPAVFSLNVKGHLRPQLAVLTSLGVPSDALAEYISQRPMVLGEGVDTIIRFLRLCRVPRREVARLLRTYPYDYGLALRFGSQEAGGEQGKDGKVERQ